MTGMAVFGIFMKLMDYISMREYMDRSSSLHSMLLVYSLVIGFLTAAFVSLFVGTEYSDGTLRNKLIIGHTRVSIYLSNLITCSAAGLMMCLAYLIPALAVGIPLCRTDDTDFRMLVLMVLYSFFMSLAFTSLYTLAGMICQNKALTAVITILVICFFSVASIYISAKLNEPETYPEISALADGRTVTSARQVPNPGYVRGTQREVYQFLNDFLPTGQSVILTRGDTEASTPLLPVYSACIAVAASGIGIFIFRKQRKTPEGRPMNVLTGAQFSKSTEVSQFSSGDSLEEIPALIPHPLQ